MLQRVSDMIVMGYIIPHVGEHYLIWNKKKTGTPKLGLVSEFIAALEKLTWDNASKKRQ